MGKKIRVGIKLLRKKISAKELSKDLREAGKSLSEDLSDFERNVREFQPKDLQIKDAMAIFNSVQQGLFNWIKKGYNDLTKPKIPNFDASGQRVNLTSTDQKRYVIYGTVLTGGHLAFVGEKDISGVKYLYMVVEFCEGEIDSITTVYLDDVATTDARFAGLVTLTKYTGLASQTADSEMDTQFASWTTNHKGNGVCYCVLKLKYDKDKLNTQPKVTALIKGKKVYDVRTSTTAWSANPALCIYDYLTNSIYGFGIATAELHTQSFIDAANYCDATVTEYTAGPTMTRFACNGKLDTDASLKDNLDALKSSCMAYLPNDAGQYRIQIEQPGSATFAFTTANIIGAWSFAGVPLAKIKNRVKVNFLNATNGYTQDLATKETTVDNGQRLEGEYPLPFETNYHRALWFADTILKKTRLDLTAGFVADHTALKVQSGDIVSITHPTPGWTAKLFRVMSTTLILSGELFGCLACEVIEHDDTIYDRTVPAQDANPPNTSLPDPYNVGAVTSLSGLTGAAYNVKTFDGSINYRAFLSWTAPTTGYINRYEVQYKKSADSWGSGTIASLHPIEPQIYVEGLKVDTDYDFRVRAQNDYGVDGAWTTTTNVNPSQESDHFFVKEPFQSLDAWNINSSGTGVTIALAGGKLTMTDTGVGGGNYKQIHRLIPYLSEVAAPTWSKNRKLKFKFKVTTLLTGLTTAYINTGNGGDGFGLIIKAAGFYADTAKASTVYTSLFTTFTISTARTYVFVGYFTSASTYVAKITDDLGNTGSITMTSTYLPTGTSGADTAFWTGMSQVSGASAGVVELSEIIVEQDP